MPQPHATNTRPPTSIDVLIAGGSYAGLALAIALSRESGGDLAVTVVSPTFPALDTTRAPVDIRASALSRGSLHLLSALGIWSELAPHAQPVSAIELTDSALADAIRPTVLSYALDTSATHPAMVMLENHRLGSALHKAAAASPGITLRANAAITGIATTTDATHATLSTGETLTARLLVAADGGRSRLRTLAGIKSVGWPYDQSGIITIVTPSLPHDSRAIQHFLPAGPFALLPMTDNRICITWTETADAAHRILALDADGFRAEVEQRFGHRLGALTAITQPQSWPLELNVARTLIAERLALVGDAAHTVHPIAGQGLNLACRDVAALTETIIDTARLGLDIGHATALERYERWRRFDNLSNAAGFDTLNRLFSTPSTLARSARGAVLKIADTLPALKSWLISEASGDTGNIPRLLRDPTATRVGAPRA